jgi:hypothetical protein
MSRAFIAVILFVMATCTYAQNNLCQKNEAVYFSCLAGKKIMSLCGSKQISESEGYLIYRFGKDGHIELEYPNKILSPKGLFSIEYQLWAHDEKTSISFKNGTYYYSIYNQFIGGQTDSDATNSSYGETAGIVVNRKNKVIADIRCSDEITIAIKPLKFLSTKQP